MSSQPAAEISAVALYGEGLDRAALETERPRFLQAVSETGEELPLALERYLGALHPEDEDVLNRATGPVLDVGCGPGRHVLALAHRGIVAVGVDISPVAVRVARQRGAAVIEASIFDGLPGAGHWGSALLLDGNIGIGGEPAELLRRIRALLRPNGVVLIELEGPGTSTATLRVRLQTRDSVSPWFRWARLGMDDLARVARAAEFTVTDRWPAGDRWFAELTVHQRAVR